MFLYVREALGRLGFPPPLQILLEDLNSPRPEVQLDALAALQYLPPDWVNNVLRIFLDAGRETVVRIRAGRILRQQAHRIPQEAAKDIFPISIGDPITEMREEAARILGQMGQEGMVRAVMFLEDRPSVLWSAAQGIKTRERISQETAEALLDLLRDRERHPAREIAADLLGHFRPLPHQAVPALAEILLGDWTCGRERETAARALSRFPETAFPYLEKAIQSPDPQIRRAAITGMGGIPQAMDGAPHPLAQDAVRILLNAAQTDADEINRIGAAKALRHFSHPDLAAQITRSLLPMLCNGDRITPLHEVVVGTIIHLGVPPDEVSLVMDFVKGQPNGSCPYPELIRAVRDIPRPEEIAQQMANLLENLLSGQGEFRPLLAHEIVSTLCQMGERHPDAVRRALSECLARSRPEAWVPMLSLLPRIAPFTPEGVEEILVHLLQRGGQERAWAVRLLGELPRVSRETAAEMLAAAVFGSGDIRANASTGIGQLVGKGGFPMPPSQAVGVLSSLLQWEDTPQTREDLFLALGETRLPQTYPVFEKALHSRERASLGAALKGLEKMAPSVQLPREIISGLISLLQRDDLVEQHARIALRILGMSHHSPEALAALRHLLERGDEEAAQAMALRRKEEIAAVLTDDSLDLRARNRVAMAVLGI